MTPDEYNKRAFEIGAIRYEHLDALLTRIYPEPVTSISQAVQAFQGTRGLTVDGKLGPVTRDALENDAPEVAISEADVRALQVAIKAAPMEVMEGYLVGPQVIVMQAHPDWYGGVIEPDTVIHHVTATKGGARGMATRRTIPFNRNTHGRNKSSWHGTAARDGRFYQMIAFDRRAYHAGGSHALRLPDGRHPNDGTIGIELEGLEDQDQTPEQVITMARVLHALAKAYGIERVAHLGHRQVHASKGCPGDAWFDRNMPTVLEAVYGVL